MMTFFFVFSHQFLPPFIFHGPDEVLHLRNRAQEPNGVPKTQSNRMECIFSVFFSCFSMESQTCSHKLCGKKSWESYPSWQWTLHTAWNGLLSMFLRILLILMTLIYFSFWTFQLMFILIATNSVVPARLWVNQNNGDLNNVFTFEAADHDQWFATYFIEGLARDELEKSDNVGDACVVFVQTSLKTCLVTRSTFFLHKSM